MTRWGRGERRGPGRIVRPIEEKVAGREVVAERVEERAVAVIVAAGVVEHEDRRGGGDRGRGSITRMTAATVAPMYASDRGLARVPLGRCDVLVPVVGVTGAVSQ